MYLHVNGFRNHEQNDFSCLCLHLPLLCTFDSLLVSESILELSLSLTTLS